MGIFKRIFGIDGKDDLPSHENWRAIALNITTGMEEVRKDWFTTCVEILQDRPPEEDTVLTRSEVKKVHLGGGAELAAKAYQLCLASDCLALHEYIPPREVQDFADILYSQVCGKQFKKCLPYLSRYKEVWSDEGGKRYFLFFIDVARYITDYKSPVSETMDIAKTHLTFAFANHIVVASAFGDVKTVEELQERMESRSSESFGNGGKRIKGNPVEEWVKKGGTLVTSGRYEEAIECCDKVLEIDPSVGPVWYNKGVALTGLERSEEAVGCYDKALEIDPMVALVWYHKADALHNLKRYGEAQVCFNRARELDPDLEISKKLGLLTEEDLREEQSGIAHKAPHQIDENMAEEWEKGVVLSGLKRHEEAIRCFDGVLEIDSEHVDAWFSKGHALADLGKYEEAIGCYDTALEIDPEYAVVWFGKGSALFILGRDEEAIQCYDKALEINPEDAIVLGYKGFALAALERHEGALGCYDKALEIDSEYDSAWYGKGLALATLERYEGALRCYDKALEINPDLEIAKKSKVIAEERLREQQSITAPTTPHQIGGNTAEERFNNGGSLATSERYEEVKTMDIAMDLEIHFHQQDEASVYLESNTSGKEGEFGEILMFCCFALRSMANLGRHSITYSLATLLSQVGDHLIELPDHHSPDDAKLVDYKGNPGRKRFIAGLRCTNENFNFKFKPKGFGLLARGMGYYAPNSVIILLRYLVEKRIDDEDFISNLSQAAKKMRGSLHQWRSISADTTSNCVGDCFQCS